MPKIVHTVAEWRGLRAQHRASGRRVGFVPTMGALHAGHLSLVQAARKLASRVTVSIFVNPAQFGPNEDFSSYPRDEARDLGLLGAAGVDLVFAPGVTEMYPGSFTTRVTVAGPAEGLESHFRPDFFRGVATVVTKLLIAVAPDVALFGEKDYQQLAVIRRLVADLTLPVEIVGYPTVREPSGLALSSRNAYLSGPERHLAPMVFTALSEAAAAIRARPSEAAAALAKARKSLENAGFRVDYLERRDAETLGPPSGDRPSRLLVAAWLGRTRLIDNIAA